MYLYQCSSAAVNCRKLSAAHPPSVIVRLQGEEQPAASETSGVEAEPGTDGQPKARRPKARLLEAMGRQLLEPTNVVLRDKISFVMGVCNVV